MDLSQACHDSGISFDPKIGSGEGLIGILTKGRINRKKYIKQCIMTALIQLENSHFYTDPQPEATRK
jgi:non-canonical (house-cleaning) NTP pyrophosphatase